MNKPHLERVSFFNADTAIITGYISCSDKGYVKNGLFVTTNGGRTWEPIDFGGDMWVYDAFTNGSGKAWIGGSSGDLFYSDDFGRTWAKRNSPYNSSTRLHSIFMRDDDTGIIGALHSDIHMTANNWRTHTRVKTPLDQKRYDPPEDHFDDRIEKVVLWKNSIVVDQAGHIFQTDRSAIDWKPFPIELIDFELDPATDQLYGVTSDLHVVVFSTPSEYRSVADQPLPRQPLDLNVADGALYAILPRHKVAKVDSARMSCITPYTTEHTIPEPEIVRGSGSVVWGVTDDQVYLKGKDSEWYREVELPFRVADCKLMNDSTAILWDGYGLNFRYTLHDQVLLPYTLNDPLADLLSAPIVSMTIEAGSRGCFHNTQHIIVYKRQGGSLLATTGYSFSSYPTDTVRTFSNTIDGDRLANIMTEISKEPDAVPTVAQLGITPTDVKAYETLVRELKQQEGQGYPERPRIDLDFYLSVPEMLDTLSSSVIKQVMLTREVWHSTTTNWCQVSLVNEHGDSLLVTRSYYMHPYPWNLPWQMHANGLHFGSCSIEFSKIIGEAVPEEFFGKQLFDNAQMLLAIADHLWADHEH